MQLLDTVIDDMGCRQGAPDVGVEDDWLRFSADEVGEDAPKSTSGEAD